MIPCFLGHLLSGLWNALKMFFVPCTSNVFSNHSDCDSASQPSDPPILEGRLFSPQPVAPVGCLFRRLLTLRHTPVPAFVDDLEAQMSSEESSLEFTPIESITSLDYRDSVSGLDPDALNGLDVDSSQPQLSGRINVSPAPSDSGVILSDDSDPMPSASSEGSETHYYDFSDEHRESDISTPNSNNSDVGDDISCSGPGEPMAAPTPISTYVPPRNRRILQDFTKFENEEAGDITRARSLSPPPLHHRGVEKSDLLNEWDVPTMRLLAACVEIL
ncbi:hypothetical protein PC9H_002646 [Pleurotus ostreatus]|uniref:Uncharacterized protein n=1 Tax=Pleurotus ostreatus TaxID=5322 RepID=A0A8H7DKN1_PLEOS|nr:uncharacterized protein PC9H_002646 [Pleurotus ostreatus]KAF7416381.1 hypothetical protein PC9H_002646 [Pleurotus ostreatus]KAJ8689285.1 hypothetical protein PTI98_013321 [Pleurotus ostreatus]